MHKSLFFAILYDLDLDEAIVMRAQKGPKRADSV